MRERINETSIIAARAMKINNARAHYVTPAKVVGSTSVLVLLALIGWMEMLREISSTITLAMLAGWRKQSIQIAAQTTTAARSSFLTCYFMRAEKSPSAFDINARATPQSYFVWTARRSHYGAARDAFSLQSALCVADFLFSLGCARSRLCGRAMRAMGF